MERCAFLYVMQLYVNAVFISIRVSRKGYEYVSDANDFLRGDPAGQMSSKACPAILRPGWEGLAYIRFLGVEITAWRQKYIQ